jgi:hypothetical protein
VLLVVLQRPTENLPDPPLLPRRRGQVSLSQPCLLEEELEIGVARISLRIYLGVIDQPSDCHNDRVREWRASSAGANGHNASSVP